MDIQINQRLYELSTCPENYGEWFYYVGTCGSIGHAEIIEAINKQAVVELDACNEVSRFIIMAVKFKDETENGYSFSLKLKRAK